MRTQQGETFLRDLPVKLDDAGLASRRDELASVTLEVENTLLDAKASAASYRKTIADLKGRASALAHQLSSRSEVRPVECVHVVDVARKQIGSVRTDTGEVVDIRDMYQAEQEMYLGEDVVLDSDVAEALDSFRRQMSEEVPGAAPKAPEFDLRSVDGVGERVIASLRDGGFDTLETLRGATARDLVKLPGIGKRTADAILSYVDRFPEA